MKRAGVLGIGGALLCALPTSAHGATIRVDFWRGPAAVQYLAAPGELNDVTLRTLSDGTLIITDPGKLITVTEDSTYPQGCVASIGVAICRVDSSDGWDILAAELGDGDDRATGTVTSRTHLSLFGEDGNDTLAGGPEDSLLRGGPGRDVLTGGGGDDTATFEDHPGPVTVTLDGAANDGEAGENDLVGTGVETVVGTEAGDTLVGDARNNRLVGNGGDDRLEGGAGSDALEGWLGDDTLLAIDGEVDRLACGGDADVAFRDPFDESITTAETCETIEGPRGP